MSIFDKLDYTAKAIIDIDKAINEQNITTYKKPLRMYGDLIRSIKSGKATNTFIINKEPYSKNTELYPSKYFTPNNDQIQIPTNLIYSSLHLNEEFYINTNYSEYKYLRNKRNMYSCVRLN